MLPVVVLAWVTWRAAKDPSPPNAVAFAAIAGSLLFWAVLSSIGEVPHEWSIVSNLISAGQEVPTVFIRCLPRLMKKDGLDKAS